MTDLEFGVWITVVGMGLVFGMLALLYGLLAIATRADRRWSGRTEEAEASSGASRPAMAGSGSVAVRVHGGPSVAGAAGSVADPPHDAELVAAITIAILDHVEARRLQAAPAMRSYWPGSLLFASRWVAAGRMRQGLPWRPGRR